MDSIPALELFNKSEKTLRELAQAQHAVFEAIEQLSDSISVNTSTAHDNLAKLQATTRRLDEAVKAMVPPRYFNELHGSTESSTPHRLLDIAEIIEKIFLYSDFRGLLILQRVNHKFRAVISQSVGLQKVLFAKPDSDSALRISIPNSDEFRSEKNIAHPDRDPHLKIYHPKDGHRRMISQTELLVEVKCDGGFENFVISPLYRRMFVCQPPVKKLTLKSVGCCTNRHDILRTYYDKRPFEDLEVETGVTIGHVYDAAEALAKEHRFCPLASVEVLDEEGIAHPRVTYSATVDATNMQTSGTGSPFGRTMISHNPTVSPRLRRERSKKERSHLLAYSTAKMLAAHNDLPIPTLAQYDGDRIYYEGLSRPYWIDVTSAEHVSARELVDDF